MTRKDNTNDFDLMIRSVMEDARIQPSRRVWKGVSARLEDEAASRTASGAWMRWAGACLAAAAVTAGIIFSGTFGNSDISTAPLVADNLAIPESNGHEQPAEGLVPAVQAWQEDEEGWDRTVARGPVNNPGMPAVETQEEDAGVAETDNDAVQPDSAEQDIQQDSGEIRAKKESRKVTEKKTEADPFAVLEKEERSIRRGMRTAMYAKGAISGNDSDLLISNKTSHMAPGASGPGITELSTSTYGVPFTIGLGVRFYVLPRLSIGTGIDYSLLTRTFTGKYTGTASDGSEISEAGNVYHELQYLGIPVDIYYDLLNSGKLKFYVYAGGEAEYCISNRYSMYTTPKITCSAPVEKLQYSAGLGLGVEFSLSRRIGLYLDPSVRYYFPSDQPKSVRTDRPLMVNFDAGLRFNF